MAAATSSSLNNIAAAFASHRNARISSSSSSSPSSPVVWNPQLKAHSSFTSFVGLYGRPGPPRTAPVSIAPPRRRIPIPSPNAASTVTATVTPISVGDRLPDVDLAYFSSDGELQTLRVSELTKGKKVVLFAVPGAFTPTCTQKHFPGFLERADELRAKGVHVVACVSVNDAFVMRAWGESLGVGDKLLLLSDGNAHFTKALGAVLDLSDKPVGLGIRSKRYSLLADDGIVKVLNLEDGGSFTISGADDILKVL